MGPLILASKPIRGQSPRERHLARSPSGRCAAGPRSPRRPAVNNISLVI